MYSLGVTLLEIITGTRKDTHESRLELERLCEDKLLFRLIDMMLEVDEERRPCFKQLHMLLLEEGFATENRGESREESREENRGENRREENTKVKSIERMNWAEVAQAKTVNKKN